jgi:mono/diheme cytochrome c family protein
MPAPPHDDSGHTWHHPDEILFGITKLGVRPPYGPPSYESDMPAFGGTLTDRQIWDVLAYIKSRWSARAQQAQLQIQKQYASTTPK